LKIVACPLTKVSELKFSDYRDVCWTFNNAKAVLDALNKRGWPTYRIQIYCFSTIVVSGSLI